MSWSENRTGSKPKASIAAVEEKVRNINAVFEKLSKDEDFQDDLKLPIVEKALKHWTNQHRLPPEEAMQLQENRRVVYVLQRFQIIQAVCRDALIPIPLDLILLAKTKIHTGIVSQIFKAHGYVLDEPAKVADSSHSAATAPLDQPSKSEAAKPAARPAEEREAEKKASADAPTTSSATATSGARDKQERSFVPVALLGALVVALLAALLYFAQRPSSLTT